MALLTDEDLGIAGTPAAPDQPAPAEQVPAATAPAPGAEGRQITVRPQAPPKPPPRPIEPHPSEPLAVPPAGAPPPDAEGQKPPAKPKLLTDEDLGIKQPSSTGVDLGRSALTGLAEGTEGLLGLPADIKHGADYGLDWAGAHVRSAVTGEDANELMKSWKSTREKLEPFQLPGSADIQAKVNKFIPSLDYKPETGPGRYVHEIAAFAPSALATLPLAGAGMAAKVLPRLAETIAPAIGSESLGHMAEGTWMEPWARMIGAVGGGGAQIFGKKTYDAGREWRRPSTEKGQQELAAEQFRAGTSAPDEALQKLRDAQAAAPPGRAPGENIEGSKPTTGQVTGDLGQLGMERAAMTARPEMHAERMTSQRAAQSEALGKVQPTGAPETVADLITKHLQAIDDEHEAAVVANRQMHEEVHGATHERMSQAATRAEEEAMAATGRVARKGESEALGEGARKPLVESMAKAKAQEKRLWDAIQSHKIGVWTNQVAAQARNIAKRMGQMQKPMAGDEKRIFDNAAGNLPRWTKLSDLTDLRSDLTTTMRQERITNGSTPALKRMTQLLKTVDNVIKNAATRQSAREAATEMEGLRRMNPQDQAAYQAARTATKARGDIERGPAGAIVRSGATSGTFRTMSSQVPGKVFAAGPTGGQKLKAYTKAGGGMDPVHDIVSDSLAREATTDGVIDAGKLKRWQAKYSEALNELPDEIRKKFVGGEADAAAALAEGAAARREALVAHGKLQVSKEFEKQLAQGSPLAKELRADSVIKALEGKTNPKEVQDIIGGLLTRTDAISRMGKLAKLVEGDPAAADGLKRAVLDNVIERITSVAEAGTTEVNALKPGRAQEFLKTKREALKAVGFSDQQLGALDAIAADIQRQQRINATRAPGQSNTAQDLFKHLKETGEKHGDGPLTNLLALKEGIDLLEDFHVPKAVAVPAGAGIGLIKHFVTKARNAGLKNVADIIHNAVMNPDQAEHLLNRPPKIHGRGSQATLAEKWRRQALYAGVAANRGASLHH